MNSNFVHLGPVKIEYFTIGTGSETVVCLHGHGRSVSDFTFLSKENRRLILLVLPFHGKSHFPEERIEENPISTQEFNELFEKILDKENVSIFHFVAFSQGGRFVLSLIPYQKHKIKSVYLISPDGMDYHSFYNRKSRKKWARKLFTRWENNPERFIRWASFVNKLGFIRPKVYSFIQKFAADKETFKRASMTWRGFRNINADLRQIDESISAHHFPFFVIMGKYDQVIRTRQAVRFLEKLNRPESLIEIECGHDFFKEKNIPLLESHIKI
jgi:pimeloyl-ACP methyl ester carboxylesterase